MKLLLSILILNFCAISAAPAVRVVSALFSCDVSCNESNSCNEEANKECCNTNCNYQGCCSFCFYVEDNQHAYNFNLNESRIKNYASSTINYKSNYSPDCWQPPELI